MDNTNTFSRENFSLRLSQLRNQKKISARQMSLDLGLNKNYITQIETGKSLPSMDIFFDICSYLHISPQVFFSPFYEPIIFYDEFYELLRNLPAHKLQHLYQIAYDLCE